MAKNLLKNGFELTGYDLREERLKELSRLGGKPAANCREYELFRAGMSLFPDEDNWSIVKLLEQIAGVEVKKQSAEVTEK